MTDQQHPITPPPELVQQWIASETYRYDAETGKHPDGSYEQRMCDLAAQWGADQELEACCAWVSGWCPRWPDGTKPEAELRAARRPKPPSLKQEALEALSRRSTFTLDRDRDTIRRALEQLDD